MMEQEGKSMETIQRYEPEGYKDRLGFYTPGSCVKYVAGTYVRYDDHIAALAAKDAAILTLTEERDEAEEYLPEASGPYQTLGERTKLLKDQMEYAAESGGQLARALEAANDAILALKGAVHADVAEFTRDSATLEAQAEQIRVLKEALNEAGRWLSIWEPDPKPAAHRVKAALASTAPVAEAPKCDCHMREKQVCNICQNVDGGSK